MSLAGNLYCLIPLVPIPEKFHSKPVTDVAFVFNEYPGNMAPVTGFEGGGNELQKLGPVWSPVPIGKHPLNPDAFAVLIMLAILIRITK